jgi:hypothetical protein
MINMQKCAIVVVYYRERQVYNTSGLALLTEPIDASLDFIEPMTIDASTISSLLHTPGIRNRLSDIDLFWWSLNKSTSAIYTHI